MLLGLECGHVTNQKGSGWKRPQNPKRTRGRRRPRGPSLASQNAKFAREIKFKQMVRARLSTLESRLDVTPAMMQEEE